MIIIIVLLSIFIMSFILFIVNKLYFKNKIINKWTFPLVFVCATSGFFSLIVCGYSAVINGNVHKTALRYELQTKFDSLFCTWAMLKYSHRDYLLAPSWLIAITEYNEMAQEWKNEITTNKEKLNTPSISWLVCNVYDEFNENDLSYIFENEVLFNNITVDDLP